MRPHIGVENAELPVEPDMAEYLDSDPDMENPNDDPTSRLGSVGSGGGSGSPICPGWLGARGGSPICREAEELWGSFSFDARFRPGLGLRGHLARETWVPHRLTIALFSPRKQI